MGRRILRDRGAEPASTLRVLTAEKVHPDGSQHVADHHPVNIEPVREDRRKDGNAVLIVGAVLGRHRANLWPTVDDVHGYSVSANATMSKRNKRNALKRFAPRPIAARYC